MMHYRFVDECAKQQSIKITLHLWILNNRIFCLKIDDSCRNEQFYAQ